MPPKTYADPSPRPRGRRALAALVGIVLTGTLVTAPPAAAEPGPDSAGAGSTSARRTSDAERAKKALRIARRQVGDAYKYGAEGPRKFDCSGLVYFATRKAGFATVPRTSSEQADHVRRIQRSKLRRGDLVFLRNKGGVYHVGFYTGRRDGDRMILHAPGTGEDVRRDPVWTDKWFAGTLRGA